LNRARCIANAIAIAIVSFPVAEAFAQDHFEIQVYDSETAPVATPGIELHLNAMHDARLGDLAHVTMEPHLGISRFAEIGLYVQTAIASDGIVDFAGIKARVKARHPRRLAGMIGLALNIELSWVPSRYEENVWGSEVRPVIDLHWRRLYLSINPIIDIDLAGRLAGHPQLEPAAKLSIAVAGGLTIGAEYYAAFGALDSPAPLRDQLHLLLGAVDLARKVGGVDLALDLAAGGNFAGPDERWVVKAIVTIGQ